MPLLLLLGFSSGLPLFLTSTTLQAWMTDENVDLGAIGLFSLVGLPYTLKFLWSPFLDRYVPPFLGRRRGWMVVTQVALFLAIAAMSLQQPRQALQLLALNAVIIAFLSASQDIAFDAYRTDVLEEPEMGLGAAIAVTGYRLALIVTGGVALGLSDRLPWPTVYIMMAILMGVGLISTIFAPEPLKGDRPPRSLADAVILPFTEFFQRKGVLAGISILVFIVLFKYGDAVLSSLSTTFLKDNGFTNSEIGAIRTGMGIIATIVGTFVGGAILSKIGINRALWTFGILQAVSNLTYFVLAQLGKNYTAFVLAINIDNFCGGLGDAAFVAFLMSLCNPLYTATQYALLSSLFAATRTILVAPAGFVAAAAGWPFFFLISIAAAIPGLALLPIFAPWNQPVTDSTIVEREE